ncbi:hypothetical protein [Arsukibacterium sp.]|uniref:hypothetical protein n=1 Tax=Arsukibacterium sp. TaxID=1977258 RepID=UPI002FD94125
MKKQLIVLISMLSISGCQLLQSSAPVTVEPVINEQVAEVEVEIVEPEPASLALTDDAATLQAWVQYRALLLTERRSEGETLLAMDEPDPVARLQRMMWQLHPDTPYLTRLRMQMQLPEQLNSLPANLAALLSWDLAFNQKLLEAESAVSALTRLNAQQHDAIERLQKSNRELQKKIDALTQIEAQLNKSVQEDNNGQG